MANPALDDERDERPWEIVDARGWLAMATCWYTTDEPCSAFVAEEVNGVATPIAEGEGETGDAALWAALAELGITPDDGATSAEGAMIDPSQRAAIISTIATEVSKAFGVEDRIRLMEIVGCALAVCAPYPETQDHIDRCNNLLSWRRAQFDEQGITPFPEREWSDRFGRNHDGVKIREGATS